MGKRLAYILLAPLLLALAAFLLLPSQLLLVLINQSFLIGLFLLMLGSIALVLRSGFFSVFAQGFKQLKQMLFKRPRAMESDWFQESDPVLKKKTETLIRLITSLSLRTGAALLFFSLALTCLYLAQS